MNAMQNTSINYLLCLQKQCGHIHSSYSPCRKECPQKCQEQCEPSKSLCSKHNAIKEAEKALEKKEAEDFYREHTYIGKHWEKADEYGPLYIYHYVHNDCLEGMTVSEFRLKYKGRISLEFPVIEIWPNDPLYYYR